MKYPNDHHPISPCYNPNGHEYIQPNPDYYYSNYNPRAPHSFERQQPVRGQATWTNGGQVTKCGIPWAHNQFMTAAVGRNSPYACGQSLKIRNLSSPFREIIITIVDQVADYPANRISLHRRAFEALGANPSIGVLNVEITPSPEVEQEKWGKYLLEVAMTAYPGFNVIEYNYVGKTQLTPQQTKETFDFILQSPRERITIRGSVVYNPVTNRVVSFDLVEV